MRRMLSDIKFAISNDFLSAFAEIPRNKQRKVSEFITRFQSDPASPGINYEPIRHALDKNMKSVRIDKEYRGIVYKPSKGNVYLLLHVALHDDAYKWAEKRRCSVNTYTNSVQVYEVSKTVLISNASAKSAVSEQPALFGNISKNNLLKMGIPEDLTDLVYSLKNREDFAGSKQFLPEESYEALSFVFEGIPVDEVINEMFLDQQEEHVDAEDFDKALKTSVSKQKFVVFDKENEHELQEMLTAPLDQWRVFLHRSQRKIVENDYSGSARVLGGAGTGKTVVAMHRAKYLAEKIYTKPDEMILFTTFTTNLVEDIRNNLKKICSPNIMKRIEIVNIDRWANEYLLRNGYEYELKYGKDLDLLWERAYAAAPDDFDYDIHFLKDEWEYIVAAKDIDNLQDYLKCSRKGRGVRAGRRERVKIWKVMELFRKEMDQEKVRDINALFMDARVVLKNKGTIKKYRSVIVDEAQDLSPQAFMLIRELMGEQKRNDIFIVGDAHQRIYGRKISLKQCGVNIQGRSSILKINYRTPEETRNWAFSILKGFDFDDLNEGIDTGKGYKSLFKGPEPKVEHFETSEEEIEFVYNRIKKLIEEGADPRDICAVFRTRTLKRDFMKALHNRGMETYQISPNMAEDRSSNFVRIATMHRVKGLEFEHIFIVSVNKNVLPLNHALRDIDDPVELNRVKLSERSLLYVAATRSKSTLTISSYGTPSEFLLNQTDEKG
ncbi:MAG TPA: 3'-5' exonuclease [Thermotogota bacterium]|mgnify:FL=1|nr:3'-5' exonuclease [Thermotogota bacterium]